MGKPLEHAENNVKRYGGSVEDYLPIHELMDISKSGLGDKRHRAIFHNATAVYIILPKIFGQYITNSNGVRVSTAQIAEDHVLEDFEGRFVPTLQDWLEEIPLKAWMDNGKDYPPSTKGAFKSDKKEEQNYVELSKLIEKAKKLPHDSYNPVPQQPVFDDIPEPDFENIVIDGANKNVYNRKRGIRDIMLDGKKTYINLPEMSGEDKEKILTEWNKRQEKDADGYIKVNPNLSPKGLKPDPGNDKFYEQVDDRSGIIFMNTPASD